MLYPRLFGYWCGAVVGVPFAHASTLPLIYTLALRLHMLYRVIIKYSYLFILSVYRPHKKNFSYSREAKVTKLISPFNLCIRQARQWDFLNYSNPERSDKILLNL